MTGVTELAFEQVWVAFVLAEVGRWRRRVHEAFGKFAVIDPYLPVHVDASSGVGYDPEWEALDRPAAIAKHFAVAACGGGFAPCSGFSNSGMVKIGDVGLTCMSRCAPLCCAH